MERHITLPLTREEARTIKSGEQLLLSGVIYTARDAAHKRLCELVEKGEPLPEQSEGGESAVEEEDDLALLEEDGLEDGE